jgi:deazaflavin-dependent oxidoreductase (nitroreductase family)
MKTVMRVAGSVNTALYRASKGRLGGKVKGMPILLLTVKGRKTGVLRTTPVVYFMDGDDYIVSGSAGGQPAEPNWFRNLRATDTATVEVGDRRFDVSVAVASDEGHAELWSKLVVHGPFFNGYQAKTTRQIPLARLTPR